MSKINPSLKPTLKFEDTRLAGGSGALATRESNEALLRRVVMANLLWEDIAYVDSKQVSNEIQRLLPLVDADSVYKIALKAENEVKAAEAEAKIAIAKAKGEAKANKITANGEAYYNRIVAASLNELLVRQYAIEKWDGKLPTYSGNNTTPFINIK